MIFFLWVLVFLMTFVLVFCRLFLDWFEIFFGFLKFFLIFFQLLDLIFFYFFLDFLRFFGFFKKLLRLLLKNTEVTTEHQKWHKISTNSRKSSFLPGGQKKPRPKAEARRKLASGM